MKNRPVTADLLNADRQKDGRTEIHYEASRRFFEILRRSLELKCESMLEYSDWEQGKLAGLSEQGKLAGLFEQGKLAGLFEYVHGISKVIKLGFLTTR
jgi:hypothetical protein